MTYQRARNLVLLSGLIVVGLVVLTMIWRGVDPVEVTATLFYAPILVGLLYWGAPGGLILGLAAAAAYVAMRMPAIRLVGIPTLAGLLTSRILGFLVFGTVGGWAAGRLQAMADKLVLYDEVDDETGLGNARSVVEAIDTERSRADRYGKVFSVVVATFDAGPWDELSSRQRRARLRSLGDRLGSSIRDSDHAAHAREEDHHLLGVALPETGAEGAATVSRNLSERVGELTGLEVRTETVTYPGDDTGLDGLTERFRRIDAAERP